MKASVSKIEISWSIEGMNCLQDFTSYSEAKKEFDSMPSNINPILTLFIDNENWNYQIRKSNYFGNEDSLSYYVPNEKGTLAGCASGRFGVVGHLENILGL